MSQKSSQHWKTNSLLTKNETGDFATIRRKAFKKWNIYVRQENNSQDIFLEPIKNPDIQKLKKISTKLLKQVWGRRIMPE